MNDEPYESKLWKLLKKLEILSYIAGAASILGAIVFRPEVLTIVPWAVGVYLAVLGLYLVTQGIYLRRLRTLYEKALPEKPD